MTQEELEQTIAHLIALGGEKEELGLWRFLYPTLSPDRKLELEENLKKQLALALA